MRLLDIARSAYVASPAGFRKRVAPLVALVPNALKYGGSYRRWSADIARSRTDFTFVAEHRQRHLTALLRKAHQGSSFYRARLDAAFGADLEKVTASDLERLPPLTKAMLRDAGEAALAVPRQSLDAGYTSGSNGEPAFSFWRDRDRSVREIAFVHAMWARVGFRAGRARALLRDAHLYDQTEFLSEWDPSLAELRLSVFPMTAADMDDYLDLFDRHGIRFIQGFPSAIELLARHVHATGRQLAQPVLGILPTSEPLYPHQRRIIRAAFGNPAIAPFYGLSEKVAFAGELEGCDDVYEFEPTYGIAELVDEDGRGITEPGQEGRILGTSFITTGMPFLRYDTQDRARLVRVGDRSNGWRMRVSHITPRRKPGFLVDADGRRFPGADFTPEKPEAFAGLKEFQFYQDMPGLCVIRYVAEPHGTRAQAEAFRTLLQDKAGSAVRFELDQVEMLDGGGSGKRPYIIQRLDLDRFA